jgi:hypothetical protein
MSKKVSCVVCGEPYSKKRAELGYRTCLDCGEVQAKDTKEQRKGRTAPLYNKGPYQYLTDGDALKSLGRKV